MRRWRRSVTSSTSRSVSGAAGWKRHHLVRNSILWGNTARTNGQQVAVLNSSGIGGTFVTATYCDLQGGSAAVFNQLPAAQNYVFNNLQNVNPAFVGGSDYHLTPASPVIGTGHPTVLPAIGVLDLDGDPRLLGLRTDLGMDEFDDCTVITFYGPLTPNTAGPGAQITLVGSTSVSANNATLRHERDAHHLLPEADHARQDGAGATSAGGAPAPFSEALDSDAAEQPLVRPALPRSRIGPRSYCIRPRRWWNLFGAGCNWGEGPRSSPQESRTRTP